MDNSVILVDKSGKKFGSLRSPDFFSLWNQNRGHKTCRSSFFSHSGPQSGKKFGSLRSPNFLPFEIRTGGTIVRGGTVYYRGRSSFFGHSCPLKWKKIWLASLAWFVLPFEIRSGGTIVRGVTVYLTTSVVEVHFSVVWSTKVTKFWLASLAGLYPLKLGQGARSWEGTRLTKEFIFQSFWSTKVKKVWLASLAGIILLHWNQLKGLDLRETEHVLDHERCRRTFFSPSGPQKCKKVGSLRSPDLAY